MAYFEQLTHAAKNAGARYQYNCPPCCVLKADNKEFTILKFNVQQVLIFSPNFTIFSDINL